MIAFSMSGWYETLSTVEQLFWVIALISSALFIIQVIMALIGFDAEGDGFIETDGIDGGFSLISFRTILAFLVCFGWIGVVILHEGGSVLSAFIWATLAGLSAMVMVAYLLYQLIKMDESGTVDLYTAIGTDGEVYILIPEKGQGKISIDIEGKLMELDAQSLGGSIPTGAKITVVDILEDNIMIVEQIN